MRREEGGQPVSEDGGEALVGAGVGQPVVVGRITVGRHGWVLVQGGQWWWKGLSLIYFVYFYFPFSLYSFTSSSAHTCDSCFLSAVSRFRYPHLPFAHTFPAR